MPSFTLMKQLHIKPLQIFPNFFLDQPDKEDWGKISE